MAIIGVRRGVDVGWFHPIPPLPAKCVHVCVCVCLDVPVCMEGMVHVCMNRTMQSPLFLSIYTRVDEGEQEREREREKKRREVYGRDW